MDNYNISSRQVIIGGVLTVQILFFLVTLLDVSFFLYSGMRLVITILYLSFIPGMLILGILGFDLDRVECIPYSLAISLSLLMALGLIVNTVFLSSAVFNPPFTEFHLIFPVSVLTFSLLTLFWLLDEEPELPALHISRISSLHLLSVLVLGNAVLAAVIINRYDTNLLALFTICFISVLPPLLLYSNNDQNYPSLIWLFSLSILYLSSLIHDNLHPGDAMWEYYHSNLVLTYGFWDPTFPSTYNTVLRLTVLHPIYTELTGLSLYWEYKIVHPFLFSFLSLVLYLVYSRYFDSHISLIATALYVFSFPFFARYSRDTRSGLALFFIAVVFLIISDKELKGNPQRLLVVMILFGLVVSHYGLSLLFLEIIAITTIAYYLYRWFESIHTNITPFDLIVMMLILVLLYYSWYMSIGSGIVLNIVRNTVVDSFLQFSKLFAEESNAGHAVLFPARSFSYEFVKYQNVLFILISAIGWFIATIYSTPIDGILKDRFGSLPFTAPPVNTLYLSFAVGAGSLLASNFLPTQILGAERTVVVSTIFLMPLIVYTLDIPVRRLRNNGREVFAIILVITLLINSGFVAALLNERSPHPNIDRKETLENGGDFEKFHLYHSYRHDEEVTSSNWLLDHKGPCDVYGSGSISQYPVTYLGYDGFDHTRPPGIYYHPGQLPHGPGYLYLSAFSQQTGLIHLGDPSQWSDDELHELEELNLESTNIIYDNNKSTIVLNEQCN